MAGIIGSENNQCGVAKMTARHRNEMKEIMAAATAKIWRGVISGEMA
jgi:hypothetical protein